MKKLTLILIVCVTSVLNAQDVFQKQLFSADLVLKYKDEINLSEDKVQEIKKIYNDHITTFNIIRWDLDAHMSKMNKLLSAESVDETESESLMNIILEKEEELKKMRFEMMVKLKNMLTIKQQKLLHELKAANGDPSISFIASMNENPRVSIKVQGEVNAPQPLFIVKDRKGQEVKGKLEDMDPDEIESITVLKGESAIEMYGKEAENGVVLVVLKR